jgi:hypothetical protein
MAGSSVRAIEGPRQTHDPSSPGWRGRTPITAVAAVVISAAYLAPELVQIINSAYFNLDDFNNLYWTQDLTLANMLGLIIDPRLDYFRPAGMFWYWLMGMSSQLDPVPFHSLGLALNWANVALLALLVLAITGRALAAVLTSVVWITSPSLIDTLWWFGSIFEIVFTGLYLGATLAFLHLRDWRLKTVVVVVLYFLAIRTKEMAITLPVVLLLYEVIVQRRLLVDLRRRMAFYGILAAISADVSVIKVNSMAGRDPSAPYFFNLTPQTLIDDAGWYAAHLFAVSSDHQMVALSILLALVVAALIARDSVMVFGLTFAAVSIAPVIFLPNHVFAFFLYLPSIGIWLSVAQLAARLSECIADRLRGRLSVARAPLPACLAVAVFLLVQSSASGYRVRTVEWTQSYADVFRRFVTLVRSEPEPPPRAMIEVTEPPQPFDGENITLLYRVLYGRQDIRVRVVHDGGTP